MQLSQIVIGFIAGGVLLSIAWAMDSKLLRLVALLVTAAFVISGLGVSRNAGMVMLAVIAAAWVAMSLYLKHKPREMEFGKDFMQDLKARVEVREALAAKEVAQLVPTSALVPAVAEVIDLIELTEEEKIANLEKDAVLAERKTEALLKIRAAEHRLQQAKNEDAEKAARLQKQLEKEKNQPPPPMTPEQKVQAILELETARSKHIQQLRDAGHTEDSLAIAAIDVEYDNKLKSLHNIRTAK